MKDKTIFNYKNFNMVTELDVSGTFIYEGIKQLNRIEVFSIESEIFYFLYNVSVGIERLQKVLLVLLEKIDSTNIEEFEKSIKTHKHHYLNDRIKQKCELKFSRRENEFFQFLDKFYSDCRYERFNVFGNISKEIRLINNFIESNFGEYTELQRSIYDNSIINTPETKKCFCRIIGKISKKYYDKIYDECHKMNLYTYELRSYSPAGKIFGSNFQKDSLHMQNINEAIALKELIVFLMNTEQENSFLRFLKSIKSLDLDPALSNEYIEQICKGEIPEYLVDEVEACYDELENRKERFEVVNLIGDTRVDFGYAEIQDCYECVNDYVKNKSCSRAFVSEFLEKYKLLDELDISEELESIYNICQSFLNSKEYSIDEFYNDISQEYEKIQKTFIRGINDENK